MKKVIAYPITWLLYWTGDWISKWYIFEKYGWFYNIYNKCMCWSVNIQEWGKLENPWKEPNK